MSHKLKLGVALAVIALALPTLAAAQDPSTRTDLVVIGAVSSDTIEPLADTSATAAPDMPIVYDDAAPTSVEASDEADAAPAEASTADPSADFGHAVESE